MCKAFYWIICLLLLTANVFADQTIKTYGPTKDTDSLWSIAAKMRPNNDVSIPQVVIALYRFNPRAFHSDNINAINSGKILKLPSLDVIKQLDKDDAYKELIKQNRQWDKELSKLNNQPKNGSEPHKNTENNSKDLKQAATTKDRLKESKQNIIKNSKQKDNISNNKRTINKDNNDKKKKEANKGNIDKKRGIVAKIDKINNNKKQNNELKNKAKNSVAFKANKANKTEKNGKLEKAAIATQKPSVSEQVIKSNKAIITAEKQQKTSDPVKSQTTIQSAMTTKPILGVASLSVAPAIQPKEVVRSESVTGSKQLKELEAICAETQNITNNIEKRITAIEEKHTNLQTQITQLDGRMLSIAQSFELSQQDIRKFIDNFKHSFLMKYTIFAGVFGIVVFLILIFLMFKHAKKTSCSCKSTNTKDNSTTNNCCNSPEDDVSSKLNLARAYIDMGKIEDAQAMLHEILNSYGISTQEQEEARMLLSKTEVSA